MPNPIPKNQNIYVELKEIPPRQEMERMDVYTDFYGISFIVYGDRKLITKDSISIISKNNVGFTDKHLYHRATYLKDDYFIRYLIKFTDTAITDLLNQFKLESLSELLTNWVYKFNEPTYKKLKSLFQDALETYNQSSKYSHLILEKILHQIILIVLDEHLPISNNEIILENANEKIIDALNYINENFASTPTIEQVATMANFSPSHFSRIFKKSTNMSFSAYLSSVKLQHATLLLQYTNKSIEDIAELCGYSNGSYLSARFKEINNISPHKYRSNLIKNKRL